MVAPEELPRKSSVHDHGNFEDPDEKYTKRVALHGMASGQSRLRKTVNSLPLGLPPAPPPPLGGNEGDAGPDSVIGDTYKGDNGNYSSSGGEEHAEESTNSDGRRRSISQARRESLWEGMTRTKRASTNVPSLESLLHPSDLADASVPDETLDLHSYLSSQPPDPPKEAPPPPTIQSSVSEPPSVARQRRMSLLYEGVVRTDPDTPNKVSENFSVGSDGLVFTRRSSSLLTPSKLADIVAPETEMENTSVASVIGLDEFRASLYSKESELLKLKVKLENLTKENAASMNALLCMVYKLNESPLPKQVVNNPKVSQLQSKAAPRAAKTTIDLLMTPAPQVPLHRRSSKTNSGQPAPLTREWTTTPAPRPRGRTTPVASAPRTTSSAMRASLHVNASLRKDALQLGQQLFDKEYGTSGKYGKSLFLVESMQRASKAVEEERKERKKREAMNAARIHSEKTKARDRVESYYYAVDPTNQSKSKVAAQRLKGEKNTSVSFALDTKRKVKVALDPEELDAFKKWQQSQQI